jgi:protein TonB
MFEQSVIREGQNSARSAVTLPVAIGLHAVAVVSAAFAAVWQVSFPLKSPAQYEQFLQPPVIHLPAGNPQPKPQPKQQNAPPRVAQIQQAPTVIPDEVRPVEAAPGPSDAPFDPTATAGGDNSLPGDGFGPGGPGIIEAPVAEPPRPVGGDVKAPIIITRVEPVYPAIAVKLRRNGFVIVSAIIDEQGNVIDASVLKSTDALFEQPALSAVQRWKYKPGTLYGRPISTIFNLTVTFKITGS